MKERKNEPIEKMSSGIREYCIFKYFVVMSVRIQNKKQEEAFAVKSSRNVTNNFEDPKFLMSIEGNTTEVPECAIEINMYPIIY